MIYTDKIMHSLDDIAIMPVRISEILSRSECCPVYEKGLTSNSPMYPIITAPMDSVVADWNYEIFSENRINPVIPRTVPIEKRLGLCRTTFCAFSMEEVEDNFLKVTAPLEGVYYILIDVANGHMSKQLWIGSELVKKYGEHVSVMGGNIANPWTYKDYLEAGFSYVRVGIGGGKACTTSVHSAIHFPMASLLDQISKFKDPRCKVIADGGITKYSDVIKCLALGADYVMMGRTLAGLLESAGELVYYDTGEIVRTESGQILDKDLYRDFRIKRIIKEYHGMSTKEAQAKIRGEVLTLGNRHRYKTSEGRVLSIQITGTVSSWVSNMDSYLRSAMSYRGVRTLSDFINHSECILISESCQKELGNK